MGRKKNIDKNSNLSGGMETWCETRIHETYRHHKEDRLQDQTST